MSFLIDEEEKTSNIVSIWVSIRRETNHFFDQFIVSSLMHRVFTAKSGYGKLDLFFSTVSTLQRVDTANLTYCTASTLKRVDAAGPSQEYY